MGSKNLKHSNLQDYFKLIITCYIKKKLAHGNHKQEPIEGTQKRKRKESKHITAEYHQIPRKRVRKEERNKGSIRQLGNN